ncbi:MAG TPA: hypothetical protein DDW52_15790 [Planctomycetaceae bacterium]|nr:hypothetical protein [Planctomycetaceae bacterium]
MFHRVGPAKPVWARISTALVVVTATLLVGCDSEDPIRVYTVSKADVKNDRTTIANDSESQSAERRMLGAILPSDDAAWFFKLSGDVDQVDKQKDSFRSIVGSVKFEDSGVPDWDVPEGWRSQRGEGITFARLRHESTGLEATVTSLPIPARYAGAKGWQDYILVNVNRWRGQLSLSDQEWDAMSEDLDEFEELSVPQRPAYFVSLVGKGSGGMRPPFASMAGSMSQSPQPPSPPPASDPRPQAAPPSVTPGPSSDFKFDIPESWTEEEPKSRMRLVQMSVAGENELSAELTISRAGGSIEMNMSMWLSQVGQTSSEKEVSSVIEAAETVTVNGADGKLYTVAGTEGKTILLTEVAGEAQQSVFIKLLGDSEVVEAQRDAYVEFIKSLTW